MKISKRLAVPAAAMALVTALSVPAAAASASSASSVPQSGTSSSARCHHHGGGSGAMTILASLTGKDVETLTSQYPQKTAWQIAKQMGKLDELKKEFLAKHKSLLDKLAADGKITADDSAKMYADMQKRVAAIDGVNTVVLGRPGYRPQMKAK